MFEIVSNDRNLHSRAPWLRRHPGVTILISLGFLAFWVWVLLFKV